MATPIYRWQGGGIQRMLQSELVRSQGNSFRTQSRGLSSTGVLGKEKDEGRAPTKRRAPSDSSPMGIGSSSVMRDQGPSSKETDAADIPLRITRVFQDVPESPRSSTPVNARVFGASRPQGPRLQLSPEVRARNEANRRARGATAARAGGVLRAAGRLQAQRRGSRRRRRSHHDLEDERADERGPAVSFSAWEPAPRKTIDHTPENLELEDLRVDWPTIPTGNMGMVQGVSSRLRWMARKMQHGYDTPQDLALRMHRGELVQLESPQEREEVPRLARELAEQRATRLAERRSESVEARDPSFRSIGDTDRALLANRFIKGLYPHPGSRRHDGDRESQNKGESEGDNSEAKKKKKTKKQQTKSSHAFLDHVQTALANNHTYHDTQRDQLVTTIQQMLAARPAAAAATTSRTSGA